MSSGDAYKYCESIGATMKTPTKLEADAKTLEALAGFVGIFEQISPEPSSAPRAALGEDNSIFIEVWYKTDEDTFLVGDHMAEVSADIVEETDVTVVLALCGCGRWVELKIGHSATANTSAWGEDPNHRGQR
jgi:hypothetical protein